MLPAIVAIILVNRTVQYDGMRLGINLFIVVCYLTVSVRCLPVDIKKIVLELLTKPFAKKTGRVSP
jgi:hypothetical protein